MSIVYLHGFSSSPSSTKARLFRRRLSEMGLGLEVPDLNEPSFETLTITRVIRRVETLLPSGDRGALVGSSMGGFAAALFAGLHPERVNALVLMAPAFNLPDLLMNRWGPEGIDLWRKQGRTSIDHPAFAEPQNLHFDFLEDAVRWAGRLPNVQCPTLIMHGLHDTDVPIATSEALARGRPNIELTVYEAGHSLEEVVDEVLDRATEFLVSRESIGRGA